MPQFGKEKSRLFKKIGQAAVFILLILLIIFFCSLITPQASDAQPILYAICFLCALLLILVVSGGIEISFGDLFRIKRDTEEIKREMIHLKVALSQMQKQETNFNFWRTVPLEETQMSATELDREDAEDLIEKYNPEN